MGLIVCGKRYTVLGYEQSSNTPMSWVPRGVGFSNSLFENSIGFNGLMGLGFSNGLFEKSMSGRPSF